MERLTENDRGTFLVKTQGSAHVWDIHEVRGEVRVQVTRYSSGRNPFGCDMLTGRPYKATVDVWPSVHGYFTNIVNGGAGDVPWTRSSTIRSIERIA